MKFLLSLFVLLAMTLSCDSSKKALNNSKDVQMTLSGNYVITQIGNNDTISPKLMISFDETSKKITGFAGCNSFFGTYSTKVNTIVFSNIASTKKYCAKNINNLENQFITALNSTNTFSINENVISLLENERILLTANKRDPAKNNANAQITYQAMSRGSFQYIQISEGEVLVSTDKSLIKVDKYKCDAADWEALNKMLNDVNIKTFQKLKAPTDKRLFDGAAHTTLSLLKDDVVIITPSFDEGHPPEEIKDLVNKVLSIKENTVKQ